jgi:hypothetical protein
MNAARAEDRHTENKLILAMSWMANCLACYSIYVFQAGYRLCTERSSRTFNLLAVHVSVLEGIDKYPEVQAECFRPAFYFINED